MPVHVRKQVMAVCEFFSYEFLQEDSLWIEVMASIGSALGPAIERERSEEALRSVTGKLLNAQDEERRRLARLVLESGVCANASNSVAANSR